MIKASTARSKEIRLAALSYHAVLAAPLVHYVGANPPQGCSGNASCAIGYRRDGSRYLILPSGISGLS